MGTKHAKMTGEFYRQKFNSPVGEIYLISDDKVLYGIIFAQLWPKFKDHFGTIIDKEKPILKLAKQQLVEYFAGKRKSFDLPVELTGTTFQKKVWQSLVQIQYGTTQSYQEQAVSIQSPSSYRAVGRANGLNPLCIVLPCHRVVASTGALTGYAGGLKAKKYLLDLESNAPKY